MYYKICTAPKKGFCWPKIASFRASFKFSYSVCSHIVVTIKPITVAARSEARNVFARSNTGIVGSNRTQGVDVCLCLFCVGSGLASG
jgi:hypothetical protein